MPDNKQEISFDHEGLHKVLSEAQKVLEDTFGMDMAALGPADGAGLDPSTVQAMNKGRDDTRSEVEKAIQDSSTGARANKEAQQITDEGAAALDGVTPIFDSLANPASGGAGGGFGDLTGASPTHLAADGLSATPAPQFNQPGQFTPQSPLPQAPQSPTLFPGMSPDMYAQQQLLAQQQQQQYLQQLAAAQRPVMPYDIQTQIPGQTDYSQYTPAAGTATQYDLNNAPNKEELAELIYQALGGGEEPSPDEVYESSGEVGSSLGSGGAASDEQIIQLAQEYANADIPYAWGGGHGGEPGPSQGISDGGGAADANGDYNKVGLDCSGLAREFTYKITGEDLANGTAAVQYETGRPVSGDEVRPGDLFFPSSAGVPPSHVAVYIGNNQILEAPSSGQMVQINPLTEGEFRTFR